MYLSRLLTPESISIGWPGGKAHKNPDKWQLIADLIFFLSETNSQVKPRVNTCIQMAKEREKSMSTGIGDGVAIPHASVPDITQTTAAVCILENGLNFESIDRMPVHIVILILMPKDQFQKHIQTLAAISKLLHSESSRKTIMKAKGGESLYKKIIQLEKKLL